MNTVVTIILTVVMFGILIFIHEFGHFITAKMFKVKVNEFALGMGPKLFSFGKGETRYSLRLLPIGGYVSMEGETEDSDDPRAFRKQKVWKRIVISGAGVFMNFVLGLAIAISLVAVENPQYLVSTTVAGVVSEETELKAGDKIVSIAGYRIFSGEDISFGVSRSDPTGKTELIELETEFVVIRDGEKITLPNVKPFVRVTYEDETQVVRHGFFEAVSYVRTTVLGLVDLITGRVGIDSLGGVIKVGQVVGEATKYGVTNLLYLMALISVNLGVMNLLPIPALDGCRFLFLLIEAIRRKPLKPEIEGYVHLAGFALLMLLMIVVTFNDIVRLVTKG